MNIIETFYHVWKADTSDLESKEAKVAESADKATKKLSDQDKQMADMQKNVNGLIDKFKGLIAAYLGWAAIKSTALAAADETNKLAAEARSMYLSADELNTWSAAVRSAGGTTEGLVSTLKMLSERTRDPLGALERVANRFKGLSDRQADRLGKSLGIDQSLVDVLRGGTEALQARIERAKLMTEVTKEQIDIANKYKLVLEDSNIILDDTRRRIMTVVLPALTWFMEAMNKLAVWMKENKESLSIVFGTIAAIITARLIPAMVSLGIATLTNPFFLMAAAAVALAAAIGLVVDDIIGFEEGAKSLIGDIAQRWPIIGDIAHAIGDALQMLWELVKAVFQYFSDVVYKPEIALAALQARVGALYEAFKARFPVLGQLLDKLGDQFVSIGNEATAIFRGLQTAIGWVWDKLKGLAEWLMGNSVIKWLFEKMAAGINATATVVSNVAGAVVNNEKESLKKQGIDLDAKPTLQDYKPPTEKQITTQRETVKKTVRDKTVVQVVPKEQLPQRPTDIAVGSQLARLDKAIADNTAAQAKHDATKTTTKAKQVTATVEAGKEAVRQADKAPTNNTTSSSIVNSNMNQRTTSNKTVQVTTGPITVQAGNVDAQGVAGAVGKSIADQVRQANDEFDNGIVI